MRGSASGMVGELEAQRRPRLRGGLQACCAAGVLDQLFATWGRRLVAYLVGAQRLRRLVRLLLLALTGRRNPAVVLVAFRVVAYDLVACPGLPLANPRCARLCDRLLVQ